MNKEVLKADQRDYYVSLAPHIRSDDSTQKIMRDVIIALVPAIIGSFYFFKLRAAILIAVCIISCVLSEYIFQRLMKKQIRIYDLSAVVTGILIAFNVPATMPWWMAAIGSIFAIVIVKECFGGVGFNFMNPAIAARIMIMASWAQNMTNYVAPDQVALTGVKVDAVASATPLQIIASGEFNSLPSIMDMFIGNTSGVLGETSALLLLIGFLYLVIRKVVTLEIPIIYIATTAIMLKILGIPFDIIPYEILGGGLMLGALFMATDYASSPINRRGRIIFALGCAILTALIRVKGSLPEGVSYAIAFMNVATPLIDKLTKTSAYGEAKS